MRPCFDISQCSRLAAGALLALALAAPGTAVAAAPDAVAEDLEAARAPVGELDAAGSEASRGTRFFRFQQEVDGVEVLGAEAVVADAPSPSGELLVDDTRARIADPGAPQVDRDTAVERAVDATGASGSDPVRAAEPAILPDEPGGTLVWRVVVGAGPGGASVEVLVDARSGEVVRERDLFATAQGTAQVFNPNAVVEKGSRDLSDLDDADSPELTALRSPVDLLRLDGDGSCLSGQWVRATLRSGLVCGGPSFDGITRRDDRFEAVMAYFHIDRTQAYFQSLGFANVANRQTLADVNAFNEDQSFYDFGTRGVSFGAGGVDDGEDGDVIVHEYGHAVQDAQSRGLGSEGDTRAMGEGFSDYLAAVMARQSGNGNEDFDTCMFEWDARGYQPPENCGRRVGQDLTLRQVQAPPCSGEAHCAGEAWSGALWDLRAQLGAAMDADVLQSHFYHSGGSSFNDGARALLAADRALHGGAHQATLQSVLGARGFLDSSIDRELTLRYKKKRDEFRGALFASEPGCVGDRPVKVYRKRSGADRSIGKARTGADGSFDVRERRPDGRFYAKSKAQVVGALTCLSARSPTRKLD